MTMFRCKIYLNGTIRGHYLEDVEAVAVYSVYPAEPDVGIIEEYVDLEWLESKSGHMLGSLTRQMSDSMYNNIVDQIVDLRMGE